MWASCFAGILLFQFHEGPIKTTLTITLSLLNIVFQFHEGPIKTLGLLHLAVRNPSEFQFHEGPIKTSWVKHRERHEVGFNSMKVRLKQNVSSNLFALQACFNSMKVRLKRDIPRPT